MCKTEIAFFDLDFIKDVTTALIGALIGTMTAVCIYIGSNKKEKTKEKELKNRQVKNKLLYTRNLILNFKTKLDDTIQSLENLIKQFENHPIDFHLPVIAINESSSLLAELLKSENTFVSHNDYFGIDRIKNYNNLRNEVAFFEIQMQQLLEMNIRAKDYDFQRKKEMMDITNSIMRELTNVYNNEKIDDNDKNQIFEFSSNFEQKLSDKTDVKFYYEQYLSPLMGKLMKHNKDKNILSIVNQIKNAMIVYQHIEFNNVAHSKNLQDILEKMYELKGDLEIDSKHILIEDY